MKHYAPLTGDYAMTGGSGTFDLPADYADTDTVYILAEDTHNGDTNKYLTDYASAKVQITLREEGSATEDPSGPVDVQPTAEQIEQAFQLVEHYKLTPDIDVVNKNITVKLTEEAANAAVQAGMIDSKTAAYLMQVPLILRPETAPIRQRRLLSFRRPATTRSERLLPQ